MMGTQSGVVGNVGNGRGHESRPDTATGSRAVSLPRPISPLRLLRLQGNGQSSEQCGPVVHQRGVRLCTDGFSCARRDG